MTEGPLIGTAWLKPDYRSALEQAGARIRELTPNDSLPAALEACDGLLLTGGVDVEPALYGEPRHPTVETDEVRDAYELALAREALERNLPVLAICRGAQVLNVAAGGTLLQDIPSAIPESLTHQIERPKNSIAHEVQVEAGSCLARLLERRLNRDRTIAVNSRHHQSVKQAAPDFVVSATSPDGIIEAIEKPDAPFCVGVQWHPENFWQTGEFHELFDGLVNAAGRYRAERG
jgi:putative glutamine amidotransferase